MPAYNLCISIGIALAMLYLQYLPEFKAKPEDTRFKIHLSLLLSILTGFAGAYFFDAYTQGISVRLDTMDQVGLTFFSGLLTGIFILCLFLKIFSLPVLTTLNQLTLPFCIAHIFGRIGCFLAGCCFGAPTDSVFGVTFPRGSLPYMHYHGFIKIHPTQLYESFFVLLVFLALKITKAKQPFFIYLASYSVFRFFVEFIRADNRGTAFNQHYFSPSQLISLITLLAVALLFMIFANKIKRSASTG